MNRRNDRGLNALDTYLSVSFPEEKELAILLFAAGEVVSEVPIAAHSYYGIHGSHVQVPDYLKNLVKCRICRRRIRDHLMEINQYINLFVRITVLPLTSVVKEYLFYDQSVE